MMVWTSRCCAPSCRSRTTRRRASSPAVSRRAREAVSWSRLSALAIAVSSSSANCAMRSSVSARRWLLAAQRAGDRSPEPAVDDDRRSDRRADPPRCGQFSERAVRVLVVLDPGGPPGAPHDCRDVLPSWRHPRCRAAPRRARPAMGDDGDLAVGLVAAEPDASASSSRSISAATASKTAVAEAPSATSVATRRSAACSSASRSTSLARRRWRSPWPPARLNSEMRVSVSGGNGSASYLRRPPSRPICAHGHGSDSRPPSGPRAHEHAGRWSRSRSRSRRPGGAVPREGRSR